MKEKNRDFANAMAKTKRKQLAALAALKVTSPGSSRKSAEDPQDGLYPALNERPIDNRSGSPEIRQQRIIFWIPPLEPSPRLVNSRNFRISGTPRKRRLSSVNDEEKSSSDGEDGHVYKKYAKIILKLDSWNSNKNVDATHPIDVPPLDSPPVYAEKAYQRRKPHSRTQSKGRVLSLLTDNGNHYASTSLPANKNSETVDVDHSRSDGENPAGDREPSSQYSRRSGLRARKTALHGDLVSFEPGSQQVRPDQGGTTSRRKSVINSPRKLVSASQKDGDAHLEKTQEVASLIYRRQKTKSLKDTVPQLTPTSGRLDEGQRKLRSAEKLRMDPEAGLSAQVSELNRTSKEATRNTTAPTEPTSDDVELAAHADSPGSRKRVMSLDRPSSKTNNFSSRGGKLKSQRRASGGLLSLQKPVARIRKKALARRASMALVQKLAALDDYRLDSAVPVAAIDPVWNRVVAPSIDEPNELHNGSDVVTSSNNAALNSRSRRVSFQGRQAGTTLEELKRVNLGSDARRGTPTPKAKSTSQSRVKTSLSHQNGDDGRNHSGGAHQNGGRGQSQLKTNGSTSLRHQNGDTGHNQLGIKYGEGSTSLRHESGDNGHISRVKSGGATTSLQHESGDNGHIGRHRNGDNADVGTNPLRARSSLQHHKGRFEFIRQQMKVQSRQKPRRSHEDVAAMVRSKLDEVGGLTEWLIGGGLGVFVDLFQEQKIEEGDLPRLTMSSLKEIGVQAVGPRRKLIWMIEHLL